MTDPRAVYSQLLGERQADIALRERRHQWLGYGRLAGVVGAAAMVWLALVERALSIAWALLPIAAFVALAVIHDRLLRRLERRRRAARFFERVWPAWRATGSGPASRATATSTPSTPTPRTSTSSAKALFSSCSPRPARTSAKTPWPAGCWRLPPPRPCGRASRLSNELRSRLDLRESLAVVAEEARTGVNPTALAAWGEAPPILEGRRLRLVLWALTALGILGALALMVWLFGLVGVFHLPAQLHVAARDLAIVAALANGFYLHRTRHSREAVVAAVEEAGHELGLLSEVLVRLERERFQSPLLAELRQSLDSEGAPPSGRMARLDHLLERLDSRDHVLVRMLEPFILWTMHVALEVEDWRRHSGAAVRRWLTATGEIEALCSLASHAFEHPGDPFPEFTETGPLLEAEAMGHPLIPAGRVVRNDVRLAESPQVLVVSGSNMSGKSTLLRTLGINAILAQAGAPVCAARLRLSPLAVGASIRLTDSLQDGVSRFYAEILRIRQILDITAGPLPVLFLIDEFLHGTNSHDRRIGAEALVRALVARCAIGLVTTHDLALADIAGVLGERAANVHFEDQLEDGKIHFDYVLRPGVVRKSNAIELMRSVGLEI